MWTFRIRTGEILNLLGVVRAVGYAGKDDGDGIPEPGEGKNDPDATHLRNIGPIPVGRYRIGAPFVHPTAGEYVMRLHPLPGTDTFGRSGFLWHGDSGVAPGTASKGCIVSSRSSRMEVWESGDHVLEVVRDAPSSPVEPAPVPPAKTVGPA